MASKICNPTTQLKIVSFCKNYILTTVTKDPTEVANWISETTANLNGHRLLIGMDIKCRPNFTGREVENRVAILQLCVGDRCLIFQIIHSPEIPQSLINFLNNPCYRNPCHADVKKLVRNYRLGRQAHRRKLAASVVDLAQLAAQMYGLNMKGLGLKELAQMLLGMELENPNYGTLSNWDNEWLLPEQIKYATLDAFLSFEIGRDLIR